MAFLTVFFLDFGMAAHNQEVEIKIPVDKAEFDRLTERLSGSCGASHVSNQLDDYFNAPHRDFLAVAYPFEWLSIRKRGPKVILNYKHFFPENVEVFSHCEEFETDVGNRDGLERLFVSLGFRKIVSIEKKREAFVFQHEFEIALDDVKDLGFFVEIEALKDFGGVDETRLRVHRFAESLGLNVSKADKRGYPYLLLKKKGLMN